MIFVIKKKSVCNISVMFHLYNVTKLTPSFIYIAERSLQKLRFFLYTCKQHVNPYP